MANIAPQKSILLNADVGEGFAFDVEIIELVDIANIACGAHAGDKTSMSQALETVKRFEKRAFAHLGYADRPNFGRISRQYSTVEFTAMLEQQLDSLCALAAQQEVALHGVKPHGALYHDLSFTAELADLFMQTVNTYQSQFEQFNVIAQANSNFYKQVNQSSNTALAEAFIDRRYTGQGNLVSRTIAGAVITEPREAGEQALKLSQGEPIDTIDGERFKVQAQTLCLHGDTETALSIARKVTEVIRPETGAHS